MKYNIFQHKNGTRITRISLKTQIAADIIRKNPRWNIRCIRVQMVSPNSL